jgi:hypothetical protein
MAGASVERIAERQFGLDYAGAWSSPPSGLFERVALVTGPAVGGGGRPAGAAGVAPGTLGHAGRHRRRRNLRRGLTCA